MSLDILIRVDSSGLIGSGHAMRCLNLAIKLRFQGCNVTFLTRQNKNNCNFLFIENSFDLIVMKNFNDKSESVDSSENIYSKWLGMSQEIDAMDSLKYIKSKTFDWIIVDHYALDYKWHDLLRSKTKKIMVIDDLANRTHNCDLLLDQNFFLNKDKRYLGLVPSDCECLLGPEYLLLSSQFEKPEYSYNIRKKGVSRVLVFFGSIDNAKQTELAISAIESLKDNNIIFDVIVGKNNLRATKIENLCNAVKNIRFYCQVDNMSEFIFKADFSLGAGGATSWERIKLGLPSAVAIVADNQDECTKNAEEAEMVINLGHFSKISSETYLEILKIMINSPSKLRRMSEACFNISSSSKPSSLIDRILSVAVSK